MYLRVSLTIVNWDDEREETNSARQCERKSRYREQKLLMWTLVKISRWSGSNNLWRSSVKV